MPTNLSMLVIVATIAVCSVETHHGSRNNAHYKFGYGVNDPYTHDHKHHHEERHGNHVVGEYGVKEPDGTHRIVKYVAGPHSGFKAFVEEIGKRYHFDKHGVNDIGVFQWDGGKDGGSKGKHY